MEPGGAETVASGAAAQLYQSIAAAAAEYGLLARGGVGNIVLIGTAGSAFWPFFQAARRDEPDPLDNWSRRVVGALAERFGARPLLPQDGPPFLPFQRWAMAAEPVFPSPMGVLVHPQYGLWHSYRGALEFAVPVPLPPRAEAANPCETCADKPCIAGCPVGAAVPYDVPRCKGHLAAEGECRRIGCLSRHACPLGRDYAYVPEQATFHMEAFLTARWC
ncbi:MAG TPA: ferredoxin [Magnetospirillum sp.]|nr:ferredoxin [Magnetospirillum sp.]